MKIMKFISCLLLPMTILSNNITYSYEDILGEGQELIINNEQELLPDANIVVHTKPSDSCNVVIKNVHRQIPSSGENDVVSVTANNGIYSVPDNSNLKEQGMEVGLVEYNGELYIANYEKVDDMIMWYGIEDRITSEWDNRNKCIIYYPDDDYHPVWAYLGSTPVF